MQPQINVLVNYQDKDGAFLESSDDDLPLHYAMRSSGSSNTSSSHSSHLPLTAHVLIALDAAAPLLTGHVKVRRSVGSDG